MGERKLIGVCMAGIHENSVHRVLNALCEEAEAAGYCLRIFNTFSDLYKDGTEEYAQALVFKAVFTDPLEALVIFSETIKNDRVKQELADMAHENGVPVFTIKAPLPGCMNIRYDAESALAKIIEHLIVVHNCRRINFVSGIRGNDVSERRNEVYREVLSKNNIPVEEERIAYGGFWAGPTRKAMDQFFASALPFPDAIVCANDAMAIEVCNILNKREMRIPGDIIVTGLGGITEREHHFPLVTTAVYDPYISAKSIMRNVTDVLSGRKDEGGEALIPCKVEYEESCGCMPHNPLLLEQRLASTYEDLETERKFYHEINELISMVNFDSRIETLSEHLPQYVRKPGITAYRIYIRPDFAEAMGMDKSPEDTLRLEVASFQDGSGSSEKRYLKYEDFIETSGRLQDDSMQILITPINSETECYGTLCLGYHGDWLRPELLYELMVVINICVDAIVKRYRLDTVNKQLTILSEQTIQSLAEIVEAKSEFTGLHVKRVSEYTRILAQAMGYSPEDVNILRIASMMHDIGKINVPSEILEKPGKLTPQEFEIIKTHVTEGARMLEKSPGRIMETAKVVALEHHEWWNGKGYLGMKGEEIHRDSRIVSVADVFDALVSERPYKAAYAAREAYDIIVEESGTHFDPEVVDAFKAHFDEFVQVMTSYVDVDEKPW